MNSEEPSDLVIDLRSNNGTVKNIVEWFDLAHKYVASYETRALGLCQDDVDFISTILWSKFIHIMNQNTRIALP